MSCIECSTELLMEQKKSSKKKLMAIRCFMLLLVSIRGSLEIMKTGFYMCVMMDIRSHNSQMYVVVMFYIIFYTPSL